MMRSLRTALAATVLAVTAAAMAQEAAPDTADCTFHQGTTTCFGEIVYPTEPFTESVPAGYVYCGGNGIMYSWHTYNWHPGWARVIPVVEKHPVFLGEVGGDIKKMDFIPADDQEDGDHSSNVRTRVMARQLRSVESLPEGRAAELLPGLVELGDEDAPAPR